MRSRSIVRAAVAAVCVGMILPRGPVRAVPVDAAAGGESANVAPRAGSDESAGWSPSPPLDVRYRDAAERLIGAALASDHAYLRLSQLCDGIGHRLSGSKSLERAVVWAAAAMREDGLENVRLQPVMVPHW